MDKEEIVKLQGRICAARSARRASMSCPVRAARTRPKCSLGERKIGALTADEEDGDRSFFFEMKIPVERPVLQDYLRRLFENDKLTIAGAH